MDTNIDFLLSEIYDANTKVIIFSRNGDKTLDNHITGECLTKIIQNGMPGLTFIEGGEPKPVRVNVIQHGSACIRSDETVSAAAIWIMKNGGKITKHLPADERLGSDQLFQDLFSPEVKKQMTANSWKNYETLVNARPDGLMIFENMVAEAIKQMFASMEKGDIALSVNHSPTVEAAYNYFAAPDQRDNEMAIAPMDGIILVQEGEKIYAYR